MGLQLGVFLIPSCRDHIDPTSSFRGPCPIGKGMGEEDLAQLGDQEDEPGPQPTTGSSATPSPAARAPPTRDQKAAEFAALTPSLMSEPLNAFVAYLRTTFSTAVYDDSIAAPLV